MKSLSRHERADEETMESQRRKGTLYGLGAYGIWGLFPLFWPLLQPAGALEILASRVVWSLVTAVILSIVLVPRSRWRAVLTRPKIALLAAAAVTIALNWGIYIWAVNNG